jgi:hypothetical protein
MEFSDSDFSSFKYALKPFIADRHSKLIFFNVFN